MSGAPNREGNSKSNFGAIGAVLGAGLAVGAAGLIYWMGSKNSQPKKPMSNSAANPSKNLAQPWSQPKIKKNFGHDQKKEYCVNCSNPSEVLLVPCKHEMCGNCAEENFSVCTYCNNGIKQMKPNCL